MIETDSQHGISDAVSPPFAVDDLDRAMVQLLREDGRMSTVTLARSLGITEPTARRRLKRLLGSGCIRICALYGQQGGMPSGASATVLLRVELDQLEAMGRQIAAMPLVRSVMIVGGAFNLMVGVAFDAQDELLEFLTGSLGVLPGIRDWQVISSIKVLKLGQPGFAEGMESAPDAPVAPLGAAV